MTSFNVPGVNTGNCIAMLVIEPSDRRTMGAGFRRESIQQVIAIVIARYGDNCVGIPADPVGVTHTYYVAVGM